MHKREIVIVTAALFIIFLIGAMAGMKYERRHIELPPDMAMKMTSDGHTIVNKAYRVRWVKRLDYIVFDYDHPFISKSRIYIDTTRPDTNNVLTLTNARVFWKK